MQLFRLALGVPRYVCARGVVNITEPALINSPSLLQRTSLLKRLKVGLSSGDKKT